MARKKDDPFRGMMARAEIVDTIIDPFARAVSVNAILGEHQAVTNRLVEARRKAITEAHKSGYSYQQLADALGISKTAVAKIDGGSARGEVSRIPDERIGVAPVDVRQGLGTVSSAQARVTSASAFAGVVTFQDDDSGYLDWLDVHANGYVLNCQRSLAPSGLKLHHASCGKIRGTNPRRGLWTGPYIKVCCDSVSALRMWAKERIGIDPSPCGVCRPPSDR
jgi:hypothetical protein